MIAQLGGAFSVVVGAFSVAAGAFPVVVDTFPGGGAALISSAGAAAR